MCVLVLARVELIVFTEAGVGQCFGCVLNTGLVVEVFVTAEQGLHTEPRSFLRAATLAWRLGVPGILEETQLGQVTPA